MESDQKSARKRRLLERLMGATLAAPLSLFGEAEKRHCPLCRDTLLPSTLPCIVGGSRLSDGNASISASLCRCSSSGMSDELQSEVIQEPLPLKQKIASCATRRFTKTILGTENPKKGEGHFS